jgi:hypothetical protein
MIRTSPESKQRAHAETHTALTLLDLVTALVETGADDAEVVAAVLDLVATGRVRLVGVIREEDFAA